jgi:hypothetical protein
LLRAALESADHSAAVAQAPTPRSCWKKGSASRLVEAQQCVRRSAAPPGRSAGYPQTVMAQYGAPDGRAANRAQGQEAQVRSRQFLLNSKKVSLSRARDHCIEARPGHPTAKDVQPGCPRCGRRQQRSVVREVLVEVVPVRVLLFYDDRLCRRFREFSQVRTQVSYLPRKRPVLRSITRGPNYFVETSKRLDLQTSRAHLNYRARARKSSAVTASIALTFSASFACHSRASAASCARTSSVTGGGSGTSTASLALGGCSVLTPSS